MHLYSKLMFSEPDDSGRVERLEESSYTQEIFEYAGENRGHWRGRNLQEQSS
jgi:hypothetical protein